MKSTSFIKTKSINEFLNKQIKNTDAIVGGTNGPIDRDKHKKARRR